MNRFFLNLLLAIAWMFLSGDINIINFIEGIVLGFIILWLGKFAVDSVKYIPRIPKIINLFLYFIYELMLANIKVAFDVVTPRHRMAPSIIAVPLSVTTDFEITLLANMITLTSGTLSLDVSTDRKVLYVHSMYVSDPEQFKDEIKNGFEKKLLEITK